MLCIECTVKQAVVGERCATCDMVVRSRVKFDINNDSLPDSMPARAMQAAQLLISIPWSETAEPQYWEDVYQRLYNLGKGNGWRK